MQNRVRLARKLNHDFKLFTSSDEISTDQIDLIASLVTDALFEDQHPLSDDLKSIKALVDDEKAEQLQAARKPKNTEVSVRSHFHKLLPSRIYFMPMPGLLSDPTIQRLWRLQLLLSIALQSRKHRKRLAEERLGLSLSEAIDAVAEGAKYSINDMSGAQRLQLLIEAIPALEFGDPLEPPTLNGRILSDSSGRQVRLSQQQALFMQLLIDAAGERVSYKQFGKNGIHYPAKLKGELMKKLGKAGLHVQILPGFECYSLR